VTVSYQSAQTVLSRTCLIKHVTVSYAASLCRRGRLPAKGILYLGCLWVREYVRAPMIMY